MLKKTDCKKYIKCMQTTAVIYCTQLYTHQLRGTVCSAQFTSVLRWFFTELDFTEIQWEYVCIKNSGTVLHRLCSIPCHLYGATVVWYIFNPVWFLQTTPWINLLFWIRKILLIVINWWTTVFLTLHGVFENMTEYSAGVHKIILVGLSQLTKICVTRTNKKLTWKK